jgi:hypothetical protein
VAALLGLGATAVAAQPPVAPPTDTQMNSGNVLLVDTKKHKMHRKWVYSEKYGKRYRHKRHGFVYFYDGWWYPRPYWEPGVSIRLGL